MIKQNEPSSNKFVPISILTLPSKNSLVKVYPPKRLDNLYFYEQKKIHLEAHQTYVQKTKLFTTLSVYQWRKQTQFPVVKTFFVKIKPSKFDQPNIADLIVFVENCPEILNKQTKYKLQELLYLLKQVSFGLDRLHHKFGPFQVKQNMIGINQAGLCKVWAHEKFSQLPNIDYNINQHQMVQQTIKIFQNLASQFPTFNQLVEKLKQSKTFLSIVKQIDNYSIINKIKTVSRINSVAVKRKADRQSPVKNKLAQNHQISRVRSTNMLVGNSRLKKSDQQTLSTATMMRNTCSSNCNTVSGATINCQAQDNTFTFYKQKGLIHRSQAHHSGLEQVSQNYKSLTLNNLQESNQSKMKTKAKNQQIQNYEILESLSKYCNPEYVQSMKELSNQQIEQKDQIQHREAVIRNNGWKSLTGFIHQKKQLNESIIQGQDQNLANKQIQLFKLQKLGKRAPATSMISNDQQYFF